MKVKLKGHQVEDISLIFNGLGKDNIRKATKTENILRGRLVSLKIQVFQFAVSQPCNIKSAAHPYFLWSSCVTTQE